MGKRLIYPARLTVSVAGTNLGGVEGEPRSSWLNYYYYAWPPLLEHGQRNPIDASKLVMRAPRADSFA